MLDKYTRLTPELYRYLVAHCSPTDDVLEALAEETEMLGPPSLMRIAPEQGTFMTLLAQVTGARQAVEVGTFTGYSALCTARGLGPEGQLLCCDVNEEWTAIARRYWQRAGVADRIDLRLGPALETLRALPAGEQFDIGFIDADKVNYRQYYEEILARLRPNGIILFDNVLWMGQIVDAAMDDSDTRALRDLNDALVNDPRVDTVMLPIADGLTIVRKRTADESS
jgi:caffeoyl-CoA O-methyltransferase